MNEQERTAAAELNLDRLLEWNSRFDNKVLIIFGISTGMLGLLASIMPQPSDWTLFSTISFACAVVPLSLSFVFLKMALYPDTRAPNGSLLFFGTIAQQTCDKFRERWKSQTQEDYLCDLLEQAHRNAEIISAKFQWFRRAFKVLLLAIIPWAVSVYLFTTLPRI